MDYLAGSNPALHKKYADAMENHPMRKCADEHPEINRLHSDSGKLLEVWFPREMMTWAEFVTDGAA